MTDQPNVPPPPPETPPGGSDADGEPSKPWWKRKWGIAIIAIVAIGMIGVLTDDGDPEDSDPVAAESEPEGEETPEAEAPDEAEPEPEPESEPTEEAEPATAEEAFAAEVGDRLSTWQNNDGVIVVEFEASDNLTMNMVRTGIERDMAAAYEAAFHEPGTDAEAVTVTATFPLNDQYGNTAQGEVYTTQLERSEAERVNWSEPYAVNWPAVWSEMFMHPDLRE